MKPEIFKIKISPLRLLFSMFILVSFLYLASVLKTFEWKIAFLIIGGSQIIAIPIIFYHLLFTHLSIKENTLIGFNGIFSRLKIPVDRITTLSVTRNPLKFGGRSVLLLTKSRDLIKIRYVSNFEELIDKLEELNKNITIDTSFKKTRIWIY